MKSNPAARILMIAAGLLLLFLTLGLMFVIAGIKSRTRASTTDSLPVFGQVSDFTLTNQAGAATTLADLRGRVWIADIIFTRCPGPCARMSRQMKELQDALPNNSSIRLISLTTDPEYDTPTVLAQYAEKYGADTNRWTFLTGTKDQMRAVAVGSLLFISKETDAANRQSSDDLWVHSTHFMVVDKRGQLRGKFETGGEGVDWTVEKQKILQVVRQLEQEK